MNSLALLKGKFQEEVFVFASGASAKNFPILNYREKKFICVNGAVKIFLEKNINPFAYVFNDESFLVDSLELVFMAISKSRYVFMPEELYFKYVEREAVERGSVGKIFFIERVNRPYGVKKLSDRFFYFRNILNKSYVFNFNIFSSRKNRIGFSQDLEKGYFCARTIPYVALQIAKYMGFRKVFMIGLDLDSKVGRFYEKNRVLPTSIDKDYFRFILPSFELMSNKIVCDDFRVFNLSPISRLPENVLVKIDTVKLDDILDE